MTAFYGENKILIELEELLEYYKFRKFVPILADSKLGDILHSYNYAKLKIYYNQVKKKLNITVEKS